MEITYLGHSSFKIKGKKATIITDPFDPDYVGLKFPKIDAEIVTVSHAHPDHNYTKGVTGDKRVVEGPGEYEILGVKIIALSSFHDENNGRDRGKNTIYHIEMENITITHLGDLGEKISDATEEILSGTDILMIPVGGIYTINSQTASQIITKLDPKIIIPMHYLTPELNKAKFDKLDSLDLFLKEMGKEGLQPLPKLSITKDKFAAEPTIVVLE